MDLYDHSPESLGELAKAIMALGYDEATACHYAALIGDLPISDGQGNIVMEHGKAIARLPLNFGEEEIEGNVIIDYEALAKLPAEEVERLAHEGRLPVRGQSLTDEFESAFGNYGQLALTEFAFTPKFEALLCLALARGSALTRDEVARAFPDAAWQW